jgi:fumarate hydratase class I
MAFEDLGMEAIYEFDVRDMPVTVAVDSKGTSVHQTGPPSGSSASPEYRYCSNQL